MSISNVSSHIPASIRDASFARADERAEERAAAATPERPAAAMAREAMGPTSTRPVHRAAAIVPAAAPAGTDPALWSVLTADERAYFARVVTGGPLTYSRVMGNPNRPAAATMPTGGRMDVRV